MEYARKKYQGEIWFVCTGGQLKNFLTLAIAPAMDPSLGEEVVGTSKPGVGVEGTGKFLEIKSC